MKQVKQKKKLPLSLQIGLLLLAVVILFNGYTLAKYFMEKDHQEPFVAKNFYLESDFLDGNTHTLQAGANSLSFTLMKYPDSLRVSEVDIQYTATLSGPETGSLTGILTVSEKNEIVSFDGLTPGTYTVTVRATSPYTKTLTGTFVIPPQEVDVSHSVMDGSGNPVCYLTISVGDYSGEITVDIPDGVTLDPNQTLVTNVTPNTEYRYTFFKTDPNTVYGYADFTVDP